MLFNTPKTEQQSTSYINIIRKLINTKVKSVTKHWRVEENRHMVGFTIFFLFAVYIGWKIETKYDHMKNKAIRTQTFKQALVEKENDYINRMLLKT